MEVAQFFDWLETNPNLGASAIVLWLAIMETWRKARYPDQITVAISTLEVKTRLKSTAIKQARDVLVHAGRIEWIKRKGNQCAIYKIIPFLFADVKRLQYQPQEQPQSRPQIQLQSRPIINNNDNINITDVDVISNQSLNDRNPDHTENVDVKRPQSQPQEQPQNSLNNVKATIDQYGSVIHHIQKHYQQCMGNMLSTTAYMEIAEFLTTGVEAQLICRAIDASIDANVRNWNYAKKIVNSCIVQGVLTLEQYETNEANRQASKKRMNGGALKNATNGRSSKYADSDPYENIESASF